MDSELNNIKVSLSSFSVSLTYLHVIRRLKMIDEAGGKEGRADSQGKNAIALHFIRRTPITSGFAVRLFICLAL